VDDYPIVRQGLADLINRQSDLECCGQAGSIVEAQEALAARQPHLMLLDLRIGTVDGLESIKTFKAQLPDLRILVVSQFDEMVYAERALRAGALGYVMKDQPLEELLRAIRTVLAGQLYVSSRVGVIAVQRIIEEKPTARAALGLLTDRELHVFRRIGVGRSNKEIAGEMGLSVKTIETHHQHIKYKLGLSSGVELLQQARRVAATEAPGGLQGLGSPRRPSVL
jgi:DNA-binding NarL/FixJ family response regulator